MNKKNTTAEVVRIIEAEIAKKTAELAFAKLKAELALAVMKEGIA